MAKLQPEQVTVIIDTREQNPFDLNPMRMERDSLPTGDYTIRGFEDEIRVERKELNDLVGCMTNGRERFEKELHRLMAYPVRMVVVEGSWTDLAEGNYTSNMAPNAATNTVISWHGRFRMPFVFAGTRLYAQHYTARFLFHECRRAVQRLAAVGFAR